MVCQRRLVLALTVTAALMLAPGASAQDGPAVPSLAWKACAQTAQKSFDCATARVPLDYDRPASQQIRLAVIRRAASDSANRIGDYLPQSGRPGRGRHSGSAKLVPALSGHAARPLRPRQLGPARQATAPRCSACAPLGERRSSSARPPRHSRRGAPSSACGRAPTGLSAGGARSATARFCGTSRRRIRLWILTCRAGPSVRRSSTTSASPTAHCSGRPTRTSSRRRCARSCPTATSIPSRRRGPGRPDAPLRLHSDQATGRTATAALNRCGRAGRARCAFSAGSARATRAKFAALVRRLRAHPQRFRGEVIDPPRCCRASRGSSTPTRPEPGGFPGSTDFARVLQALWQRANPKPRPPLPCSDATRGPSTRTRGSARTARARLGPPPIRASRDSRSDASASSACSGYEAASLVNLMGGEDSAYELVEDREAAPRA